MSVDVVGIYNKEFRQLLQTARPIKAVVKPEAALMKQPLETGATIVDHRIINPIEIELSLVLNGDEYINTYHQAAQLFKNGELLTIQTRSGVYANMVISKMPHEESPDNIDVFMVAMSLEEARFATAQAGNYVPRNPTQAKTVQRGEQQKTETESPRGRSILAGWFS